MEKENSKSIAYIDILTNIVGEQRNMTDEELTIYRKNTLSRCRTLFTFR